MSKQLDSLFQDFLSMSDEDKLEKVRQVRRTRSIEKPKTALRKKKVAKKKSVKAGTSMERIAKGMSPEELAALIAQLEEDE